MKVDVIGLTFQSFCDVLSRMQAMQEELEGLSAMHKNPFPSHFTDTLKALLVVDSISQSMARLECI